jgi:N12 class adenine-specific DNA methylase
MENNNTNPKDPIYQSKVYKALKDNLQGFNKTEQEFKEALKDKTYQSNVYKALKDNLEGFNKSEQEFYSLVADVPNQTPQKKNPNQSGVSTLDNGFSDFPNPKSAVDIVLDANKQVAQTTIKPQRALTKGEQSKVLFKQAKAKVDDNLTEERLQKEKEQSGFLNTIGEVAKNIWNVTGTGLSAVNEALGGDKDYFTIDDYKPLQDQKKKYIEKAKKENLPLTPEAIQKGAEDIFRQEDKLQQLQKNIDAALPEDYDRKGIWKELKLENLKKNDALRQAVVTADVYQKQLQEFNSYAEYVKKLPKEKITNEIANKYNSLLDDAKESQNGLKYLQETFPKLLKEVKTSDELVDVFKYNYNDYEKALSNIKNFAKGFAGGTVKIAAETFSYIDEKTDEPGSAPTSADKALKKGLKVAKEIANEVIDEASSEREQFISYKAKDINNFSDFGSYMADLGTNQLPVYLTLAIAPELGSVLLGSGSSGEQFRNMEIEEMQPLAKQTSFGQKLLTSYVYGGAETLFERLGTVNVIKNIEASIARASNASRRLMREGVMDTSIRSAKQFGFNSLIEGSTEYLTSEAQIQADRNIADKDISTQQANERRSESTVGGALMGGTMSLVGGLWGEIAQQAKLYSDSQDIQKTKNILSKIDSLSQELKNNPNLTKEDKDIIHNKMTDLANQSFDIVNKNAEKGKTFSKEENSFLVAVNLMQDGLKTEFEKIKNSNLSTEQKKALTDELNASFNQLEKNRQKTLKGEFSTIPDSEKTIKREMPQEDNLIDDNVTPTNKKYNDIWVRNEKDIPKKEDRNPNDRYNVVSNSEELKLFEEQENAKSKTASTTDTEPQNDLKSGTYEYNGKIYKYDGTSLTDEKGDLYPMSFDEDSLLNQIKNKGKLIEETTTTEPDKVSTEPTSTNTEPTDEELLNDLEVNNEEVAPTPKEEAMAEITDQEYLDFVENDFLSEERLNDIATKVRENKDLNTYEKRIAKKKENQIVGINKKVQEEINEVNRKAEVDALSKIPAMEKDEFIEYTNNEKATEERLNVIAYKNANNVELNNFEKEVYQDNKKVIDKINKERNLKENMLDKIPAEQKYQTKEGKYTVAKNGNELELYDTNGQAVTLTPKTKQKYFLEALANGFMKRTEELQYPEGITPEEVSRFELENETDPSIILDKLDSIEINLDGATASDFKDFAIASFINKVTQSTFIRFGDKNNITRGIALTYFSKDGAPIDTLAQEISESMGIEVTPNDIVDFIVANPNGKRNILTVKNPEYQNLIDKFVSLTGFRPTPKQIMDFKNKEVQPTQIDFEFANEIEVNNEIIERIDIVEAAEEFDKWFSTLTPQQQVEFYLDLEQDYPNEYYQQRYNEQQEYEQSEKITSTEKLDQQGKSEPDGSKSKTEQPDRRESGNDNVSKRESGENQNQDEPTGNANAGEQGIKPKSEKVEDKKPEAKQEEAETKQSKRKVRDEKAQQEIADALKEFLKAGRDNLTSGGLSPEKIEKGAKLIALYTKLGIYKFSDIIEDLYAQMGDGLKDIFNELKAVYAAHYNTTEDSIADQMDGNIRSVTYESIINKIQDNETVEQPIEQPITDTKPIELKTKVIESKTDKLANDREAKIPTERKLEIANDLLFDIDTEIENVNDQLRLLGFYEPNANDEMRENPHIYIERELKKDLTNFVKKLNERLKWEFDTDKKGKPIYASANIAPAGGDGGFILWAPNSNYGVYVKVSVQPKEYKDWYEQYELEPSVLWRVTTKDNKYTGLSNQWMNSEDFTIPNLVDKFNKAVSFYLKQENGSNNQQQPAEQRVPSPTESLLPNNKRPSETAPQKLLQKPSEEQRAGTRSQSTSNPIPRTTRTVKQSPTGQGDLFSTDAGVLEETQTTPEETKPKEKDVVQVEQINQVEKQEPALVEFSMQDNEQETFNATKKYTDNINALETLLTVIKEKRKATPEEKTILARYVGFGGLKEIAFNPDNEADWKESTSKYKDQVRKVIELTQELDKALGINNSLSEIRAGILTAHYTPKTIIDTMFNVLEKLGFKNGNILEPSAGIGNFIGYMPSKMRSNSNITAVELDNLTGNILKYLYDDVNTQIRGIQDAIIPDNSQDVVISNVPFGNFKVFDKAFKGNREFLTKRIHNYFFAKALDKVREGGIVMFVTSKGVLDSKGNREVREYLNQNADFLGAVRLPSTAFQNNANTSVVTDVIILRKNTTGEKKNPNFLDVVDLDVTDKNGEIKTITINKFIQENRGILIGNIVPGGMYSEKDYSLIDPENKMEQLWDRISTSPLRHFFGTFQPTTNLNATNRIETDQDLLENTKIGNLTISNDGKILKRLDSEMQEVTMPSYVKPRNVKKYIDVRVALFDLITAEYTGQNDSVVDSLRNKLKTLYANAIQTINPKELNRIATEDGDGFNVLSLTDKTGKKADILSKRTINPLQQKQNTDNIDEAIIISLYENAKVDMDRIAELMNKPVKEVLELAKGKIFESPTGGFFTRDEYLSGNVKSKLAEVKKAIESGYNEFENNKTELEAVIPKDIPAVSIEVRLGSRWVPLDIINDFANHLFKDDNVVINYMKSTDTYNNNGKASSVNATEKWGTKRKNGSDLLVDALHAATPAIYDTIDDKRVLNKEETEKAVQKFEEIRAEFENWVYTNAERRERLGQIYNEKYNTTVRRKYDGSHLNIPGINGVNLYPHQKDAIWMLLQNNGGIIDHIVGAGKTFVMVAGTAEMKRTGVARKPMILALKSTIPQIVETYKQSYPLAKILSPSEKDFQAKNRQQLFSQIALNDWDVIIMSHENYQAIPHHPDYIRKQIDDEIAEIEAERDALQGDKKALSGLETRLKNLQAKLEKITDVAKDNAVYFQQMGIDHIMVDESQQFKNLAYMTKQRNVAGLSKAEGSRRAFNLLVGMRYLQETLGADKGTTFLSGTPISNSMVEMYSLLKYMRPSKMKELAFNTFDQWATTFASPTNEVEYTVTGQFKSKTRFREFINVPELSLLYNEIADVRNDDNLTLDKPKMKGGGYTTMFIPMNEEQSDYGQRIIQFAKTKDGSVLGLELSENQLTAYMLLATNLSSKMAIDMRLINKDYTYDPNGKVGKMTDEVVKVYNETNEYKGAQLIFSDLGTPKNKNNQSEMLKDYMEDELGVPQDTLVEIFGNFAEEGHRYQPITSIKQKAIDVLEIEESDFDEYMEQAKQSGETFNLYDEIKKRLIEKGIPENEIVFIHSYNNQKAKEKLFELVNEGNIRVILGSTQKLGTGVNVQKRLAGLHHLDVPWRPSDMEQRNGRGIRQGNWIAKNYLNNEIPVYAYATEKTLDGYKYQLLQTKQRFLDQVKSGNITDRVVKENSDEGSDAYAIFVAELSGNKDILLKFKLEQEKERLTKQRRNFEGSLYEAQGNVRKLESNIPAIEENVNKTKKDIENITNKAEYIITKDEETGIETKKLKIDNINGEVLQPEKDSKEAKENKPVDRIEYGKKAIELVAQTIKNIKLNEYTKAFDINGLPILVKVTNQREVSNGKEFMIQKTALAILSPTGQTYTVNNSTIAGVLLNNIQKAIENIPVILEMQEKVLDKNKKDLAEYKELAKNDKFPKEQELTKVVAELKEVDKRIQDFEKDPNEDELDLDNEDSNDTRFQLDDQKPFETNDNTKATKETLEQAFPDAIVVQSESELPTAIQNDIKQQRAEGKVKGTYRDGKVYMIADNIKTMGEATGTYRHEMLGHKGVVDYLGKKLNEYTTRIIDNAKGGTLRKLQALANKYGLPTDLNLLTQEQKQLLGEEYIAMISENKSKLPKIWNDLVSFIREALRKLGIKLQVLDTEIQALIGKVEKMKKNNAENLFTNNTNNNLATNSNSDGISEQVSQGNNREEIKENRRVEEIASAIRESYRANQKELKGSELENKRIHFKN